MSAAVFFSLAANRTLGRYARDRASATLLGWKFAQPWPVISALTAAAALIDAAN